MEIGRREGYGMRESMPRRFSGELTFSQINFTLICKNLEILFQKLEIRCIIRYDLKKKS